MNQTKHKLLSTVLAVAMVFQTAIPTVFAAETAEPAAKTITDFTALEQTEYTLPVDADQDTIDHALTFPDTITANVEYITTEEVVVDSGKPEDVEETETAEPATSSDAEVANSGETDHPLGTSSVQDSGDPETTLVEKVVSEQVEFSVSWQSDKELKTDAEGEFTYTAALSDSDKGKYDFAEGVSLPQITVYVEAAQPMLLNAVVDTPTVEITEDTKSIYANGTPITVEKGTTDDTTSVWYMNGGTKTYVNTNGADGDKLYDYYIYGGAKETEVASTSVTMTGGTVDGVSGGGFNGEVTGDTTVNISGIANITNGVCGGSGSSGSVGNNTIVNISGKASISGDIYGGGFGAVTGSTTVNISGTASINGNIYGGSYGAATGSTTVNISETASVGGAVYGGSTYLATVTGSKNGYVALVGKANADSFTNLLYKTDATNWAVKGNIAMESTIPAGETLTIPVETTVTVPAGVTLTVNGTLVNNGTVAISEGGTLNGSGWLQNNGTVNGSHTLKVPPTVETKPAGVTHIYANGTPITIEAGTDEGTSKIKYSDGTNDVYLDLDPTAGVEQTQMDLSKYWIYGSAKDTAVSGTNVTMTGGTVAYVFGGGGFSSSTVNGSTNVEISGGTVANVYGGGSGSGSIGKNTNVTISGGTVANVYGGGSGSVGKNTNVTISGTATITGAVLGGGGSGSTVTGDTNVIISHTATIAEDCTVDGEGLGTVNGDKNGYVAHVTSDINIDSFDNLLYKPNATNWVSKGSAVIPEGQTLTVGSGDTLTLNGTLTAATDNSQLVVNDGGTLKTTVFTADDLQSISDQVFTGSAITPEITINNPTSLGQVFTVDTSAYTSKYQKQGVDGTWEDVTTIQDAGNYKIVYTKDSVVIEKIFNIVQSGTALNNLKAYDSKGNEANTFAYGDGITVKVTPTATGAAPSLLRSAPAANQMALFVGETQITEPVDEVAGVYTMTYDTTGKALTVGVNTITAKYVGNDNMASAEGSITVTLNPKVITAATVTESAAKEYNGTTSFTAVPLTLSESSVLTGDTVTATASGTVDNKNIGAEKTFTATSVALNGTGADYYSLAANAVSGSLQVTKLLLVVKGGIVADKVWDGKADAPVTEITFHNLPTGDTLLFGTDYTVVGAKYLKTEDTGEQPDSDAGYNKYVGFGAIVPQKTEAMNNFELNETLFSHLSVTGNILKLKNVPAPTFSAMDDTTDTFTFTPVTGFTDVTAYEYSMDGGATWKDVSANPISVGNVAGTIKLRIKETTNYEAGAIYKHNEAFTASLEGNVYINESNVVYGDTITATVTGQQSGAVLSYKWLAGTSELQSGTSNTLKIPGVAVDKKIAVEVTASGYTGSLTTSTVVEIQRKGIHANVVGKITKVYDGINTIYASLSVADGDKVNPNDEITSITALIIYDDANVGTGKPVTVGYCDTAGAASDWYYIIEPTGVTGDITAKPLADRMIIGIDPVYSSYTGSPITPVPTVEDGNPSIITTNDYTVRYEDNTNVGTAKIILTGKGNYSGRVEKTFTITKSDPTYTVPTNLTAKYGQTLSEITIGEGFSWMDGTKNVGEVGAQTHKAKFTPADTQNYNTVENIDVTLTVNKADAFVLNTTATIMKNQANYTVKLDMTKVFGYPAIPGGTPAFAITGGASYNGLTSATMDADGKTLVLVADNTTNDTADTVTVSVTGMGNYENSTITVAVGYTDKTPVTISGVTAQDGVYNGNGQKGYTGTPTSAFTGSYNVTYVGRNGTSYNSTTAPKNVGRYTVTISVPDSDATYFGSISLNFIIYRATVTIQADNKSAYVGDAQPALTYTVTGLANGESLQAVPTLTCTPDMSKAGSYPIIASGAAVPNTDNYNSEITYTAGTLTVSDRPSSGGGGSSSGGSTTVTTPPATTEDPKPATEVTATVKPSISGGTATVTVPESTVKDAIAKAEAEAKKNGKTESGITITIKADTGSATNLTANLPKATVDALVKAGVKETSITSGIATITLNLETMKEIQKQAAGDVTVTAAKVANTTLSAEAKAVVGNRPVYDLSITASNGAKITSFGTGKVSVSIPYTLGAGEKAGNVIAYYIDSNGKVQELANSVYDPETKLLRFVTDHFSKFAVGYKADTTETTFTDIANHWAKENIEFVAARGLLNGTGNNKFSPDSSMTRGMFVTALGRLAGADVSSYTTGSYYLGYIEWASKNGIVNGTGSGKFAPDQSISREQMAVIMQNYAKAVGFDLPKAHAENTFADNAKIGSYAKDAVKSMQMAGVLAGKNGNKFDPQGTATRAEVSAVLKRFVELVISTDNARGWMMNDSGKWMFYENGRPVTGTKTIDGTSYTFDANGVTADVPKNLTYGSYTVQKGDSFWSIASKYKCNIFELARINDKSIFSLIHPGDVLKVPEN